METEVLHLIQEPGSPKAALKWEIKAGWGVGEEEKKSPNQVKINQKQQFHAVV